MKTSELEGAALDWAVAKAWQHVYSDGAITVAVRSGFHPSTDWAQGGPIIEREGMSIGMVSDYWQAWQSELRIVAEGDSPLVAAMRCFVASKLGDEVDVPEELTK